MKVIFQIDPWMKPVGADNEWELLDNFVVTIEEEGKPTALITVPKGFKTDLASVPRLPGAYLFFANRGRRSAILHDYLYTMEYPRKWADSVFLAALQNEVGFVSRNLMYWGVRLGGGAYYQSHQVANEAEREAP